MKTLALFLGVIGLCNIAYAGSDSLFVKQQRVGASLSAGFLAAHHSSMEVMMQHSVRALDLWYGFATNENASWAGAYNYPEYGVNFSFYDLGSKRYLGYSVGVLPYISFPLLKRRDFDLIYLRFSLGMAYISKPFDRFRNYKNTAIGSRINAYARIELGTSFSVGNDWKVNAGFAFAHMSNGSTNSPNSGINMPFVSVGASHCFGKSLNTVPYVREKKRFEDFEYILFASGSIKDVFPEAKGHYPVITLSNLFGWQLSNTSGVTVTGDIIHDESHRHLLMVDGDTVSRFRMLKFGATVGYLLRLGEISANIQMGYYLRAYYRPGGSIYQRLALRYQLFNSTYVQVALRTNWTNADCIEFGVGQRLWH